MRAKPIALFSATAIALVAPLQPFRLVFVVGASMEPTFHTGSLLLATPRFEQIRRGDVVVIQRNGERFVKRIAFVGGDSYQEFRFSGRWVPPNSEAVLRCGLRKRLPQRTITVPPGMLFVVGDNPSQSEDSRSFGPVPSSCVVMKAMTRSGSNAAPYYAGAHLGAPAYTAMR